MLEPVGATYSPISILLIKKLKMHYSREVENFVETHICKLCDTPTARVTAVSGFPHEGYTPATIPLEYQLVPASTG